MIDSGLQGKTVLVTGADNPLGIGAAIATAFAAQGARVFITYLPEPPPNGALAATAAAAASPEEAVHRAPHAAVVESILRRMGAHGGPVAAAAFDLADPTTIPQLFDQVTMELGPVDVLINNAAHSVPDDFAVGSGMVDFAQRPTVGVTPQSHDQHFAVNSRAVALLMAEYARRHRDRGASWGRIVNISTDAAECFPGEISYGASKAALESYSRSAAIELGPHGITVNIVAPGPIQTGWIPEDLEPQVAADTPLGRVGQPADVADVVVFLASEQARWVTGQRLFVGGGHRL